MDTSTLFNVNKAIYVLRNANLSVMKAEDCATKAAEKYGYVHGKDDKIINLKQAIEEKECSFKSQHSILNAENIIQEIMEDWGYNEISEI